MNISYWIAMVLYVCSCQTVFAQTLPTESSTLPAASAAKPVALTVVLRDDIKQSIKNKGTYDCGIIDLLRTQRIERMFTLRNDNEFPVAVDRITNSCSCQSVVLLKGGQTVSQPTLQPGEQLDVKIVIAPTLVMKKDKRVLARVFSRSHRDPLAQLELQMQLQFPLEFQPAVLNFQQTGEAQTVTVRVESRLIEGENVPAFVQGNRLVEIVPVGTPHRITANGKTWVESTYRATLKSDVPSGFQAEPLPLSLPEAAKRNSALAQFWKEMTPKLPIVAALPAAASSAPETVSYNKP